MSQSNITLLVIVAIILFVAYVIDRNSHPDQPSELNSADRQRPAQEYMEQINKAKDEAKRKERLKGIVDDQPNETIFP